MATNEDELTLRLALTRLQRLKPHHQRLLYEALGTAIEIYNCIPSLDRHIPSATKTLRNELAMIDGHITWAREEIRYCHDTGIDILCHDDMRFPQLLNQCPDAPTVLYSMGHANYNAHHIVASVGTRRCTEYGKGVCRRLFSDMGAMLTNSLVVSGLAYGIDIESHRAALAANVPTVAVMAHGMDEIYPAIHKSTANEMLRKEGGLLTEYPHATRIDKHNFISRNRIVAGMSHATLVIESAEKGGSLITADMACGYNREVFACPGRISDTCSTGCNNLIASNKAHLLINMEGIMHEMGWEKAGQAVQGELFPTLTPEEAKVRDALLKHDEADVAILSTETGMSIRALSTLLGAMEMDGKVHAVPGSLNYRWNL